MEFNDKKNKYILVYMYSNSVLPLQCKFAVVQFGRDIRTELYLNENDDCLRALDKVKNIKQISAITKTTSALYHVL